MNKASPKLGFCAAVVAFIAVVAYGVAQIAQILNIVSYPVADILIYGASLCVSAPFLIAILALHDTAEPRNRICATGALLFGVMYVTYVVLMYAVQLSFVIPQSMESPSSSAARRSVVCSMLSPAPESSLSIPMRSRPSVFVSTNVRVEPRSFSPKKMSREHGQPEAHAAGARL